MLWRGWEDEEQHEVEITCKATSSERDEIKGSVKFLCAFSSGQIQNSTRKHKIWQLG